jgi:hypothetical protein
LPQRANRPIRTSEHSSWIGSLVSSRHKLQQASSSLTILMDGELSVVGGHSLCREAIRCNLGSPVVSISLAHPLLLGERSAIYQIVYELHLFGKRERDPRSTAQVIRAKRREIEVLQQPAPDEQGSDAQLSPVGVCSYADGCSGTRTRSALGHGGIHGTRSRGPAFQQSGRKPAKPARRTTLGESGVSWSSPSCGLIIT